MARASTELVQALRETARRLADDGTVHRWSHFGLCNCGHLAQTVTRLSAKEIQDALFVLPGDWGEKAYEACPASGLPMNHLFQEMFRLGLDREDFRHLERLGDPDVLRRVGRPLRHTVRRDAVAYLEAWADLLDATAGRTSDQPDGPDAESAGEPGTPRRQAA